MMMMKNNLFKMMTIILVVIALIAAVALTGAGYAAWSTKITYNNTMRTAAWNVFIEKDAADSLEAGDTVQNFKGDYTEAGKTVELNMFDSESAADLSGAVKTNGQNFVYTMAPSITKTVENADTVNFKFYNMHPGTKALTRFEVRNLGTIPAKVADVRVIINGGDPLSADQQKLVAAMVVSGKFWDHIGNNPSTLIGEIKGISANVKSQNLAQLEFHYQGYLDKAVQGEKIKAILIINHQRNKPLAERDPVDERQIVLSEKYESLIVETITFLKLFEKFLSSSVTSDECIQLFKTKVGILKETDF
jgi:hypothetical protein